MSAGALQFKAVDPVLGCAYRNRFCIGGVSVQIESDRAEDAILDRSLAPFQAGLGPDAADISIQIDWVSVLRPGVGKQLFDSGSLWALHEKDDGRLVFDFGTPVLGSTPYKRLIIDDRFSTASLLMSKACFRSHVLAVPLEYPLDEILITHRLTRERAIELHGCGIAATIKGAGYLFVGHSGAGKSTTARLWAGRNDVEILSDDRIIVREHGRQMFMYGTPWHGEAAFASPARSPLSGIFVLEHGVGNSILPLSASQAVSELFARSFVPLHSHEYVSSTLGLLQDLLDSVPCYRFSFEPDQRAVDKILHFYD